MKLHLTRVIKIFLITIWLCSIVTNFAIAAFDVTGQFSGSSEDISTTVPKIQKIIWTVLEVIRLVGTGIALLILMYIGAKFMMAAPSERANIKQYSINYIIGAFIMIGASGLLAIIQNFAENIKAP